MKVGSTHSLAALRVQEENSAPLTLKQVAGLCHDLGHQTLQVVLFLKDASGQVQQDLRHTKISYERITGIEL